MKRKRKKLPKFTSINVADTVSAKDGAHLMHVLTDVHKLAKKTKAQTRFEYSGRQFEITPYVDLVKQINGIDWNGTPHQNINPART